MPWVQYVLVCVCVPGEELATFVVFCVPITCQYACLCAHVRVCVYVPSAEMRGFVVFLGCRARGGGGGSGSLLLRL